MKTTPSLRNFLLGSALLAAVTATTHAQTYWQGDVIGSNAGLWSDSGNWDTGIVPTGAVRFDSTATGNFTNALGNAARSVTGITFDSATAYTIRLYSSLSTTTTSQILTVGTSGITVNSGDHKILGSTSAGNLKLTTGSNFNIAANSSLTFECKLGNVSGVFAFTKSGAGTLVLKAPNGGSGSWEADFTVSQGVIQFAAANAFGNSGNNYIVSSGAALEITGGFTQTNTTGIITLNGTGIGSNGALRSLSGTNAINSTGSIVLNTVGTNSIGVDAGTLSIANVISGTSTRNFTKVGAGTLTLSGANTYSGSTTISAGAISASNIVVSGSSNLGNAASAVTLGSAGAQGTLSYTGNGASYTRGFTIGGAGGGRLDVTTSGQTLTVDTSGVSGSGLFTVGGAGNTTINTNLTHTGGLTKTGAGTLTLSGTNTYTDTTTISQGTLALGASASITSATIIVGASTTFDVSAVTGGYALGATQTLSGTGTVTGATTVSGTLSPGNSPGTMLVGSLTWLNGGDYNWQMLDATGVPGTGFDTISMTGTLDLNSLTAGGFSINLWSLASIGPDVNGDASNFNNALNQSWNILTASVAINGFDANDFVINTGANNGTAGFSNALGGGVFSVSQSVNNLVLTYTVPEPGAALLGSLGLLALLRRRR